MLLSRIEARPEALKRLLMKGGLDSYAVHQRVWDLFADGPHRRRDFLYRQEVDAKVLTFLVLSQRVPVDALDAWHVQTKEFDPALREGDRLAFALRANPIVSRRDDQGHQSRHDVVMHAKSRLAANGLSKAEWPPEAELIQEAASEWLLARCQERGFSIEPGVLRADGYRQHVLYPKREGRTVRFSSVEFRGLLQVTDPHRLIQCLGRGIGPAKGFGCGMLVIRRP